MRAHFRPEFLNRIDETVVFHPLGRAQIRGIVDVQMRLVARRLEDRHIRLVLDDSARDALAEQGYDPAYGARPLKRVIQREILDPLAMRILRGEIAEGATIRIGADAEGVFSFQPVLAAAA
jgi:ATP-dependent Clp protease ATP-binding subunit ClpB